MNKKKLNKLIKLTIDNYGITSDKQLYKLADKLNIKINYIGFIEDLNDISKNGGYIINLANSDSSGSHWTCFYKENDEIFYYDSFAVGFEDKLLDLAKKSNIKNIIFNDYHQMQDISEDLCGIWCLIFLYYMENSKKKKLVDRFFEFTKNYEDINGDYSAGLAFK